MQKSHLLVTFTSLKFLQLTQCLHFEDVVCEYPAHCVEEYMLLQKTLHAQLQSVEKQHAMLLWKFNAEISHMVVVLKNTTHTT